MNNNTAAENTDPMPDRWTLIRDIAVLQVKLLVDSFRDIALVPISLILGIVSLVKGGDHPGSQFYELMHLGRQSEQWINLFGAADHAQESAPDSDKFARQDIDSIVRKVEAFVVDEYKKGGLTAQAKEHLDKVLDSAQRRAAKRNSSNS